MTENINWDELLGQSKYIRIEPGQQVRLVLRHWRIAPSSFDPAKKSLTFDVWKAGDMEFSTPKEWSTTSFSAINDLRRIIARAEAKGMDSLGVIVKRDSEGRMSVIDLLG